MKTSVVILCGIVFAAIAISQVESRGCCEVAGGDICCAGSCVCVRDLPIERVERYKMEGLIRVNTAQKQNLRGNIINDKGCCVTVTGVCCSGPCECVLRD